MANMSPSRLAPRPQFRLSGRITKLPVLHRRRAYCFTSFSRRLVDWLQTELKRAAKEEKLPAKPAKEQTPPSRVQPSRAVKRRANESIAAGETEPAAVGETGSSKARTGNQDYVLDPETRRQLLLEGKAGKADKGGLDSTAQQVMASIRNKVAELQRAASEALPSLTAPAAPAAPAAPTIRLCAVSGLPLGCTEMAYCLHGLSLERPRQKRGTKQAPEAPEADMQTYLLLPKKWEAVKVVEFIDECMTGREIEALGLKFVVDICAGFVKIVMI